MTRHRIRSFLPFLILSTIVACGSAEHEAAEVATLTSALTGKVIYFGRLEVLAGQLKSADGTLPSRGESVTLRAFLPELSSFMCGTYVTYCMALYPKLYVRYTGTSTFQEVPGITQGSYNMRGPTANWGEYESNIDLKVPADADRIETYIYWGRISWSGWSCYLAYDMMECPDSFGISGDYLSNYGRNFRIDVQP